MADYCTTADVVRELPNISISSSTKPSTTEVDQFCSDITAEQTAEWDKEAKTELKVYRKKLPKELYTKIHNNFLRSKVHQKFNMREFSLFQL